MLTPEQQARLNIDNQLLQAGWVIQDIKQINLNASVGVVVREYPTDTGDADYMLFMKGCKTPEIFQTDVWAWHEDGIIKI